MSRLPGMHEFCYNSWLYKVHNNFNHRKDIAIINRDGSKKFTNDPHSDYYLSNILFGQLKPEPIPCVYTEMFIIKTKLVRVNPKMIGIIRKPCFFNKKAVQNWLAQ